MHTHPDMTENKKYSHIHLEFFFFFFSLLDIPQFRYLEFPHMKEPHAVFGPTTEFQDAGYHESMVIAVSFVFFMQKIQIKIKKK